MILERCDYCCDVLNGIDGGEVFGLSEMAKKETGSEYEHLCESCFNHINSDCTTLKLDRTSYGYALIKHEREESQEKTK